MREYVALILAGAAFSAIAAMLAYDMLYPTDFSAMEPEQRLEYELFELAAKKELLILLVGGLIAWVSQGSRRD